MPDQELQLPDGRTLVIPDNITLDQRAALRNKLGAQYADIKTGTGMEQRAQQQAKQSLSAPIDKYAQERADRQVKLGERMNRASRSPTPFTTAVSAYAPMIAARAIAGGKVGSRAGGAIARQVSNSPDAEGYGELAGGLVGGTVASMGSPSKLAQRITRGPGGTGEVTVNPATIATRELEARVPMNEPPGARQQMQMEQGTQQAAAINRAARATPKPPMSRIPTRMPVRPTPAPQGATMSSTPGGSAPLPPPGPPAASTGIPAGGQPLPLAARTAARMPGEAPLTRRIILPGEEIDPLARESAGSAAQATEGDLRRLAQAGDMSAQRELVRRRLPMGPTDYSNAPLPKGNLTERIAPQERPAYKPSEKAATLSEKPRDLGPEFNAQQRQEMLSRYKSILRNPKATPEDIAEANARLRELSPQTETVDVTPGPTTPELQRQARERAARIREARP